MYPVLIASIGGRPWPVRIGGRWSMALEVADEGLVYLAEDAARIPPVKRAARSRWGTTFGHKSGCWLYTLECLDCSRVIRGGAGVGTGDRCV